MTERPAKAMKPAAPSSSVAPALVAPALVAPTLNTLDTVDAAVSECRACPRLVAWREEVGRTKRAAFQNWTYWSRPVPSFGPSDARIAIVGLAPAAHGGNRTGRMFTGDQSGDVLFAALHAVGLASQPTATSIDDGMQLFGVRMLAPVHCAPPDNKPTPTERDTCRAWLVRELQLLQPHLRSIVVLGHFGWQALLPALSQAGWLIDSPRPKFGHGAHITLRPAETAPSTSGGTPGATSGLATPDELHLFGCYHVSQHNTFTGRLTPSMVEEVLSRAAKSASDQPGSS